MSQEKLGEAVSLTFQQIQKYERGSNRISASRLYDLSRALDVPVSYFYEGLHTEPITRGLSHPGQDAYEGDDHMARRETLELVRAYYRISDRFLRKRVFLLVKAIGGQPLDEDELEDVTFETEDAV